MSRSANHRRPTPRVAVIGCGYWGPNLVRVFSSLADCRSIVCCDTDATALNRIARLYPNVQRTRNAQEVIQSSQVDAVVIATPNATHYPLARDCLLAGKHVLVEKPLAESSGHCSDLMRLAHDTDRVLMVGHTFEYCVALNKAKEIMRSGALGDVLYLRLLRLNLGPFRPDSGVMWDLMPHDVSILLYLLDRVPTGVSASGHTYVKTGIEDVAAATLYFGETTVAFLNCSWLDPCKVRSMTVVGSKKMLIYDDVNVREKIKIYDRGINAPSAYDDYGDFQFSYRYGDIDIPRVEDKEPLKIECQHFVDCIINSTTPRSDGVSGARVVRVLEALSASMGRRGEYVDLSDTTNEGSAPHGARSATAAQIPLDDTPR